VQTWDRQRIAELLAEAGRTALAHYDSPVWEYKSDRSIVTVADREIEGFFASVFDKPEDGTYLLGEETIGGKGDAYIEAALSHTAYIVDPIDGTAPYSHHLSSWGISIGLMRKGVIEEGAVYLPVTGELYITERGSLYNGIVREGNEGLRPYARPAFTLDDGAMISLSQGVCKRGTFSGRNPVVANGSCVFSLAYLVRGSFTAYIASVKLWDIAGSLPILYAAGFVVRGLSGREIGLAVNNETYELGAGSGERRFKLKEIAICAPTPEAVAFVQEKTSFGEPPNRL
jgi:myo-inositol-1(or 4)-monophosphatase